MKRVYSSPAIDGIYVLNYTDAHVKNGKGGLKAASRGNSAAIESAGKEGYLQGLNDAKKDIEARKEEIYSEGVRGGCKQAEDKLCTLFQALQDVTKQLQEEKCNIWQKSETEIIKLVLAIVQKVVGYEVVNNNQLIEKVVAEALSHVGKQKIISIRMNPADVTKLNESEITTNASAADSVFDNKFEVVADQKISPGGCVVETDFGCIDAQLETRINKVINELRVES